ncbi:MAG TPA: LptA/OstA family protein [Devosiaceae bacterium]|jgi:lipopolysaccharide export system protein LptA
MRRLAFTLVTLLTLTGLATAQDGAAPTQGGAAPTQNATGGKMNITGDKFVVNEGSHEATFTGNVYVKHPNLDLWADEVDIHYGEGGTTDVKTFEATGKVRIHTPEQDATGDKAIYDPKTRLLHLTGNVMVNSASSVLSSPELEVNLDTNTSTFTGKKGGRVTGVFNTQ